MLRRNVICNCILIAITFPTPRIGGDGCFGLPQTPPPRNPAKQPNGTLPGGLQGSGHRHGTRADAGKNGPDSPAHLSHRQPSHLKAIRLLEFRALEPRKLRTPHGAVHVGNKLLEKRIVHLGQGNHQEHLHAPISEPFPAQDLP